jgi:hypothetical protein
MGRYYDEICSTASVVLFFFATHKCVPKNISWSFLAYGSYVAHGMRMTVSSMFYELIGTALCDPLDKPCIKINLYLSLQQPKWPFLDKS